MKILFYPEPSKINAYYKILRQYCEQNDISYTGTRSLSLFRVLRESSGCKLIHINWTARVEKNYLSIIKFCMIVLILRLLSKKIIWTIHNYYPHEDQNYKKSDFFKHLLKLIVHKIYTHSSSLTELVKKQLGEDSIVETIFHPTFETVHPLHTTMTLKDISKDNANKIKILFFGYIRKYKGLQNIIKYFAHDSANHHLKLVVTGSIEFYWENSQEKEQLIGALEREKYIETNLYFIEDENVAAHILTSDLLIIPYDRYDTSGVAMLAITFGKTAIIKESLFTKAFDDRQPFITYKTDDELALILRNLTQEQIEKKEQCVRHIQNTHSTKKFFQTLQKIYI